MAFGQEQHVGFAARLLRFDIKLLVFFFIDQSARAAGVNGVAIHLIGTLGNLVFDRIKEGLIVICPGHGIDAFGVVY